MPHWYARTHIPLQTHTEMAYVEPDGMTAGFFLDNQFLYVASLRL